MTPKLILFSFLGYSLLLYLISYFTSKRANNESFFSGNKVSPWYVVAYGMIGASLSGVTFISVPGAVAKDGFTYLVLVFGYLAGYAFIIKFLLPLYYKLNVTSIYSYFLTRYGQTAYKSGASYFLLSRIIGASFRMYLVISILQVFVFNTWNIPFWFTTLAFILLILIYTFKAGIKTIVWTDTLQTTFMLGSVILTLYFILDKMGIGSLELWNNITETDYSNTFISDWKHPKNYIKQFVSGAFISIVMTGMDQDMMQKNLTCRNLKDAQKNMFWMSLSLIPINFLFLLLGAALYIFAANQGIILPEKADTVYPFIAFNHLSPIAGITFIIGLIAAAYSSADGAMTALTTSFSVDILNLNNKTNMTESKKEKSRKTVHLGVAFVLFLVIVIFGNLNRESIINELFTIAGYTYGPILGLFIFGIFTKYQTKDKLILPVVVAAPVLSYILNINSVNWFGGYKFGFELLLINGLFTFLGLYLIRKDN